MQTLKLDTAEIQFPSKWNELTQAQLLRICTLYNNGGDAPTLKLLILFSLIGARITAKDKPTQPSVYQLEIQGKKYNIKVQDLAYIADKGTAFILKKQPPVGKKPAFYSISSTLTKNTLFECNGLIGPTDGLGNITWAEFCAAQTAYAGFCHTKHPMYVHKLIAILWRPANGLTIESPNYNGDLRQPFNDFKVEAAAANIAKQWRANYITAALLYYEGCLNYITTRYADLFSPGKGSVKSNGSVFDNMLKLTLAAADNQETKMKEVYDDPAHQVLFSINEAIKNAKKLEEELKNKRHAA